MSVLPQQIPSPTVRFGRYNPQTGDVLIEKDWWLFLLNVSKSIVGPSGVDNASIQALEAVDLDIQGSDLPSLVRQISNLNMQFPDADVVPALRDVVNALTVALTALEEQVPIGALPETNGGTGQTQYAVGDLLYSGSANHLTRLAGNITTTQMFLTQTGTGTASAAPSWTAAGPGGLTGLSNPTAKVGLTAVNGSATTAMRSDGAPPIDQTITPTWTAQHINTTNAGGSASAILLKAAQPELAWQCTGGGADGQYWDLGPGATSNHWVLRTINDAQSATKVAFDVSRSGNVINAMTYGNSTDKPPHTFNGAVGVNGNSPPAQVTGWGTPTGAAVVANFPGATATLVQCSNVIAKLITDLKAFGLYGA